MKQLVIALLFNIMLAQMAVAQEPVVQVPEAPMQNPASVMQESTQQDGSMQMELGPPPENYESIMFYANELERIKEIIKAKQNNQPLPLIQEGEVQEAAPVPTVATYTYPQFYLRSIVYYGPQNWVLWINDKKITSEQRDVIPYLTITQVTKQAIEFTYDFAEDDMIIVPEIVANDKIVADKIYKTAKVSLEPNQTFSLYSWDIYEGMVAPVVRHVQTKQDVPSLNVPEGLIPEEGIKLQPKTGVPEDIEQRL